MFKKVQIKKADTCLTFVLKRLGLLDKYRDLDGDEFVEKFDMIPILDFKYANKGDVIVEVRNRKYKKQRTGIIDELGRTFESYRDDSFHFMLFEGDFITSYDGFNHITCYQPDFIELDKKSTYFLIKFDKLQ